LADFPPDQSLVPCIAIAAIREAQCSSRCLHCRRQKNYWHWYGGDWPGPSLQ
jgi:hypothetical protein